MKRYKLPQNVKILLGLSAVVFTFVIGGAVAHDFFVVKPLFKEWDAKIAQAGMRPSAFLAENSRGSNAFFFTAWVDQQTQKNPDPAFTLAACDFFLYSADRLKENKTASSPESVKEKEQAYDALMKKAVRSFILADLLTAGDLYRCRATGNQKKISNLHDTMRSALRIFANSLTLEEKKALAIDAFALEARMANRPPNTKICGLGPMSSRDSISVSDFLVPNEDWVSLREKALEQLKAYYNLQ